ncbi:FecR family protein [Flagellimonas sp.]|uniref:FecR family protein n=1 Tax=Flagellimonas sp. TaxID=2058762 RepID=UPI003B5288F3
MSTEEILKYIKGDASTEEAKQVEDWIISSDRNAKKYNLLKSQFIAATFDQTSDEVEVGREYQTFSKKAQKLKRIQGLRSLLKYAASIIFVLGTGYILYTANLNDNEPVPIPENAITLETGDNNIMVISEDGTAKVLDKQGNIVGAQSGSKLVYDNTSELEELVYNTLTVPYGKTFDLQLSDGTKVTLNAGSSIKYPVKFLKEGNREVFLIGEAFFDVAHDAEHQFVVNADQMNITVLGTKFNVSSYPEDTMVNTVLVEGSVQISPVDEEQNMKTNTQLEPGFKASLEKRNGEVTVDEADISLHTAWINGKIVFRHTPFKNIVKKLERHYNVEIINNNQLLDDEVFTASFDIETIEEVLATFSKTYPINYQFNEIKQLVINSNETPMN